MDSKRGLLDIQEVDELFELHSARRFAFGTEVAQVFDDMVSRFVPGYLEGQLLAGSVAARFYQPETAIVDIGCSTATTLALLWKRLAELQPMLVGIDSSEAMLEKARQKLARLSIADKIILKNEAIETVDIPEASVVISQYTLQFLNLSSREQVLRKIARALVAGGAFLFSEKTKIVEAEEAEIVSDLYDDFKRMNGYSDIEIARKREALKGVLIPASKERCREMLLDAGFRKIIPLMQGYPFTTWLCLK